MTGRVVNEGRESEYSILIGVDGQTPVGQETFALSGGGTKTLDFTFPKNGQNSEAEVLLKRPSAEDDSTYDTMTVSDLEDETC